MIQRPLNIGRVILLIGQQTPGIIRLRKVISIRPLLKMFFFKMLLRSSAYFRRVLARYGLPRNCASVSMYGGQPNINGHFFKWLFCVRHKRIASCIHYASNHTYKEQALHIWSDKSQHRSEIWLRIFFPSWRVETWKAILWEVKKYRHAHEFF